VCWPPVLVVASRNRGKLAEIRALVAPWGVADVRSVADHPCAPEVPETGTTYVENARGKAESAAAATGLPALGEDSGIEVDALGGRPGLHSARYGGPGRTDGDRVMILLRELDGVAPEGRGATFRAAAVLCWPDGRVLATSGECRGMISATPRGAGGFGYDPVFLYPPLGRTFGELGAEEKRRLSHRARALDALHAAVTAACAGGGPRGTSS
jgi:XTP/dITP diphosphohydrolase